MKTHIMNVLTSVITGQCVVDLVRRMIKTAGNIAEAAFLLATMYVTTNYVAHMLVVWTLPPNVISTLNQISVIIFSVLPELIVVNAIFATYDHWQMYRETKNRSALAWAVAYAIPTIIFVTMIVVTLSSFVSIEAITTNAPIATGPILVLRCLSGWFYGLLQMVWNGRGKVGYAREIKRLKGDLDSARSENKKLQPKPTRSKGKAKGNQTLHIA